MRIFIFGLGYSARFFAGLVKSRAAWIGGTVGDPNKASALRGDGVEVFNFDGSMPGEGVAAAIRTATHCLVSIPPGDGADPVITHHAEDFVAARDLGWIGYLSTVGVYGNYGGAWVSERSTPHPRPGRSARRLETEAAWQDLALRCGVPLAIFRLAGIYGPGRNALKNLSEGTARRIVKPGQVFNRIHVDDIAQTLAAALEGNARGIFNVTDNEPAPPQHVVEYAADLMGVQPPPAVPLATADLSEMARSFYRDNKRVSNQRIRDELRITLHYPTYREGLSALWQDGNWGD